MNSKEIGGGTTLLAWNYGPQHHINHFTAQVEAKAHGEQQAGLDREALKRQEVSLIEQRKKNQTKVGEVQQRRDNQECNGTNGMGDVDVDRRTLKYGNHLAMGVLTIATGGFGCLFLVEVRNGIPGLPELGGHLVSEVICLSLFGYSMMYTTDVEVFGNHEYQLL